MATRSGMCARAGRETPYLLRPEEWISTGSRQQYAPPIGRIESEELSSRYQKIIASCSSSGRFDDPWSQRKPYERSARYMRKGPDSKPGAGSQDLLMARCLPLRYRIFPTLGGYPHFWRVPPLLRSLLFPADHPVPASRSSVKRAGSWQAGSAVWNIELMVSVLILAKKEDAL